MMSVRHAILACAALAACVGSVADGTTIPVLGKDGVAVVSTVIPHEEMVAGFIVKAHPKSGRALHTALRSNDARALSGKAGNVAMRVARQMSGDASVIRLQRPVPLSEARVMAKK